MVNSTLGPGKLFRPYSQNRTFGAFLLLIGLLRNIKISIYPYECKHSTYIYLFFITLNSLYVEASGDLFVHYIVNHVLFGLYIQLYAGQVSCLLLQIVFPYVLGDLQQFFLRVGLSTELNADLTL